MKSNFKLNLTGRSNALRSALESMDAEAVDAPADPAAATTPAAPGADPTAAPADTAPADPTSTDTPAGDPAADAPAADGADAGGEGSDLLDNPVGDDTGGAGDALDAPADAPADPADTPPVEGASPADNGNAEVDALPDAPMIDSDAPADGAIAADGAPDPEVDAVTPSSDEAAIGEEIQDQTAELGEIEVGVAETNNDVEVLTEAVEELKDIIAVNTASLEHGGLDTFGARHMSRRLSAVYKSMNQKPPSFAALESADNPSDAIMETGNSTATAKGLLSQVKETLTKAGTDLVEWSKQAYAVVTDASLRVEKRALALKAAAATSGQAVQVTDAVVISGVFLNGAVPTDMARAVSEHTKALQVLNAPATYAKFLEAIDIVQSIANDPTKKSSLDARLAQAFAGYSNKLIGTTAGVIKGGSNGTSVSPMFGDKQLTMAIPTEAGRIGETKASISDVKPTGVPASVNGLDPQAAIKACDAVIAAARQLREFNKSGATHRVTERVTSLLKTQASSDGQDEALQQSISKLVRDIAAAGAQLPAYSFNRALVPSLNAVLDYVSASAGAAAPAATPGAPGAPAV